MTFALETRTQSAMQAMQQVCMQLGLPSRQLKVLQRPRRDVGFIDQTAVFYFAPHEDSTSLQREGSILDAVHRHFKSMPWKIPALLARNESEDGVVHVHSFVGGCELTKAMPQDQRQSDAVCRQIGRMLQHLHATPLPPALALEERNMRRHDLPSVLGWLAHGRKAAQGEGADPLLLQRMSDILTNHAAHLESPKAVLVHGDLHGGNILRDGPQISMIDFERAGVADPHNDFIALHPLTIAQKAIVAKAYTDAGGQSISLEKVAYLNCLATANHFASPSGQMKGDLPPFIVNAALKSALETWDETQKLLKTHPAPRQSAIFC